MKKLVLFIIIGFVFQSCRSTEEIMQKKGFRPYPKTHAQGYEKCTRNFVGYGTYEPPRRKGVDH